MFKVRYKNNVYNVYGTWINNGNWRTQFLIYTGKWEWVWAMDCVSIDETGGGQK